MEPSSEFRSKAVYNNVMYALAGQVAQALSPDQRTPWDQLVRQYLLQPLHMHHTHFMGDLNEDHHLASQYVYVNDNKVRISRKRFQ